MIEVDGSTGEGGGQLLRTAVALSALSGVPVRIRKIRAGRPNPGLAPQHVAAVQAVAALSNAEVDGLEPGSAEVTFRPGTLAGGRHRFDVGTAGSVTLVLQACLPVAFRTSEGARITVSGGTDVQWSPPFDYLDRVFLPLLARRGGTAELRLVRRGYYPRGGGLVEVTVQPAARWSPWNGSDPGPVVRIRGIAHASHLPADIPARMKHAALRSLQAHPDVKIEDRIYAGEEAVGPGGALVVWAETERTTLGAAVLAERGKSSERIGEEAALALAAEVASGSTLDYHAADQLLVYLASAEGPSSFLVREPSGHLRTIAWLVPRFLPVQVEFQGVGELTRGKITRAG